MRSTVQCQPVCATSSDRMIVPRRSSTANLKTSATSGTITRSAASIPASSPRLKNTSDVKKCEPENCSESLSATANPNPCARPNTKAAIQRRRRLGAIRLSSDTYRIDNAINASTTEGNQSAAGVIPYADAMSATECARVNDVTTATSDRRLRNGMIRTNKNSR